MNPKIQKKSSRSFGSSIAIGRPGHWLGPLAASGLLMGCSTLSSQVEGGMNLAQSCQQLEAHKQNVLVLTPATFLQQIKVKTLAETLCINKEGTLARQPLLVCAASEFRGNVRAVFPADGEPRSRLESSLDILENAVLQAKTDLEKLQAQAEQHLIRHCMPGPMNLQPLSQHAACYVQYLQGADPAAPYSPARLLKNVFASMDTVVRSAQDLEQALSTVTVADSPPRVALAAEATKFRQTTQSFLRNARTAVLGDINAAVADTLRSQLVYQQAHRLFDLVDHGLYPVETLLDRGDQKAYGVVSFAMAWGSDKIQAKLEEGLAALKTKQGVIPLGVAACERMTDTTVIRKSQTLEPIFERALAKVAGEAVESATGSPPKVGAAQGHGKADDTAPAAPAWAPRTRVASLDSGMALEQVRDQMNSMSAHAQAQNSTVPELRPLETYVLAEWAMRRQLSTITAVEYEEIQSGSNDKLVKKRRLVAVPPDETELGSKAMLFSAKLNNFQGDRISDVNLYSSSLAAGAANSLAVANAVATATASATSNQNVYISNPAQGMASGGPAQVSVPASVNFCSHLAVKGVCSQLDGGGYRIYAAPFPSAGFRDGDIEQLLRLVARTARYSKQKYQVQVVGHASAQDYSCRQAYEAIRRVRTETGVNAELKENAVVLEAGQDKKLLATRVQCDASNHKYHGNRVVAAARAVWAGKVLMEEGRDWLSLDTHAAFSMGSLFAGRENANPDRGVTIHLTPMAAPWN